jgi:hypothetical protein
MSVTLAGALSTRLHYTKARRLRRDLHVGSLCLASAICSPLQDREKVFWKAPRIEERPHERRTVGVGGRFNLNDQGQRNSSARATNDTN